MIKKSEKYLFVSHPFAGPLAILFLLGLPWWIAYWPGTLQYDSCGQLLQYLGVGRMTGHHPLPVSMLMGFMLDAGRWLFHSDNAGIFLYTGLQFTAQSLILSYAFCVYKRMDIPFWYRWSTLVFYTLFPLVPNWGINHGKDTGYYLCFLLLVLVLIDAFLPEKRAARWQELLWIVSSVGMVAFRNEGRYVVGCTVLLICFLRPMHIRTALKGAGTAVLFLVLVEGVYMPLANIPGGSVREALSVPVMQTAKYISEYGDEITEEEEQILLSVFEVEDLKQVAAGYDKDISDDVKKLFLEYPGKEELISYFKVWRQQLKKRPLLYIETWLEHCSGYFNPGEGCYEDIIGWFKILDGESRSDEYLRVSFRPQSASLRRLLEGFAYGLYGIPVIGWLFRPAIHTWIMLGCFLLLLYQRKKAEMLVVIPGMLVLLICTVSPLNASVRYFLPVMVSTPLYIPLLFRRAG